MSKLFKDLFAKNVPPYVRSLRKEPDLRIQAISASAKELLAHKGVMPYQPFEQVLAFFSRANFASSAQEQINVASLFWDTLSCPDILPLVSEHSGLDLGGRCLVSLGVFPEAMSRRVNRRGAPSSGFYRNVGIQALYDGGLAHASSNFENWEWFLGENFGADN
jgi:hypothetical protein